MLADVTNLTSDHDLDATGELFRGSLAQSARFALWDRGRLPGILRRMEKPPGEKLNGAVAREVALRENVPFVVFGAVAPLGDRFLVSLDLEQLGTGTIFSRRSWSNSFQADGKAALNSAVHDASAWLRRTVGENETEIAARDRLPQDVTTGSWEALREYSVAEDMQAQGKTDQAVNVLKTAVSLDPHFALAYMRLGDLLMSVRREEEGLSYWRLALNEANRGHLSAREELRLRGLYAGDTWDWPAYAAAFTEMERQYPNDYLASFYLADALRRLGHTEESAAKFEEAGRKHPDSVPVADNLASVYLELGAFDRAERMAAELERLGRTDLAARQRGTLHFSKADFEGAIPFFEKQAASQEPGTRSRAYWYRAACLAELGRLREAEQALRSGIDEDIKLGLPEQQAAKETALGYLILQKGDTTEAKSRAQSAAALARGPEQLLQAAILFARGGASSDADRLSARIAAIAPHTKLAQIATDWIDGERLLAAGEYAKAAVSLDRVSQSLLALQPDDALARVLYLGGRPEEALPLFRKATSALARVGWGPELVFPGMFTDSLFERAKCALAARQPHEASDALVEYLSRRRGADNDFAQVLQARQMLEKITKEGKEK